MSNDRIHPDNKHLASGGIETGFLESLGSLSFTSLLPQQKITLYADWKAKHGKPDDAGGPTRPTSGFYPSQGAGEHARGRSEPTPTVPPPTPAMADADLPPGMRNLVGAAKIRAMRQFQSLDPLRAVLASHENGTKRLTPGELASTKATLKEAWDAVSRLGGGNRI